MLSKDLTYQLETVKDVTDSELKRICYKQPFRGNSDCLATDARRKTLMFGIVDRMNKKHRLCLEWMDDIASLCKTGLQELNTLVQDHRRWKCITREAMDTNGRWSNDS